MRELPIGFTKQFVDRFNAQRFKQCRHKYATGRIYAIYHHLKVCFGNGGYINQWQGQNLVDMFLQVTVVNRYFAQVVHVSINKIAALGNIQYLFTIGVIDKFAVGI